MNNYIEEYYNAIQNNQVTVGKWIRLIYKYITKGLKNKSFFYNQKKANKAIKFIETFCHHCEGRDDLLKLELWQKAIVSVLFGIVDKDDIRQFRECVIVVARKNGKTLFASAIIAYMVYLDGEYGAKVYCLAPKLEQANIVYDNFYQMLKKESELADISKKRRSDIYVDDFNCSVKPLAFNAKKSDGFNPQLTICDEFASWQGDNGLKQYEVMKSALGARKQPLILSISTAGYINDGIYDELIKRSTAFLMGNSKETRLLPFLYIIDDIEKWNDLEELKKSNPNMCISVQPDFYKEEIAIAENSLSKKAEFMTKYCNIKQNSSVAWLEYELIDKSFDKNLKIEDFKNTYCVGGVDLSQTTDLTACSIMIERDEKLYTFCQFFMPEKIITRLQEIEGVPYELYVKQGYITMSGENKVDYKDCFNWFRSLIENYKIYPLEVGYDRYSAQYFVDDMKEYGFHMDDVWQGENLTPVIKEFEGIIRDGNIIICDNTLLKQHFLNTAIKQNDETRKCRTAKIEARCHIDGTVSVLDALTVRQKWYADIGQQLKNK